MKEFAKDIGTLQKQQKQATINSNQMKLDTLWAYLKKVSWHLPNGNLTVITYKVQDQYFFNFENYRIL
jgi:hypothetical protein